MAYLTQRQWQKKQEQWADNGVNANIGRIAESLMYFNGKIDDVRVYNRALSASEVKICSTIWEDEWKFLISNF